MSGQRERPKNRRIWAEGIVKRSILLTLSFLLGFAFFACRSNSPTAPSDGTIEIDAPTAVSSGARSQIEVWVFRASGDHVRGGVHVYLSTDQGGIAKGWVATGTVDQTSLDLVTDEAGHVVATFQAPETGTAGVEATLTAKSGQVSETATIAVGEFTYKLTVSPDKIDNLEAGDQTPRTITATLTEASGTAGVAGHTVTFSADLGTVSPTEATTDDSGKATCEYVGPSSKNPIITHITVSSDGAASKTINVTLLDSPKSIVISDISTTVRATGEIMKISIPVTVKGQSGSTYTTPTDLDFKITGDKGTFDSSGTQTATLKTSAGSATAVLVVSVDDQKSYPKIPIDVTLHDDSTITDSVTINISQ